jgi:hypothetical protein
MLTDDELARELAALFRGQAAGITYAGRRRPPGRAAATLPAAAAAIALGAGLGVALHPSPIAPARPAAAPSPPAAAKTTVDATFNLDGFILHYQRPTGSPAPLRVELAVRGLPSDARPVPLSGTTAKAWVGTDPASGDNALYLRSPARNGGRLFAVLSATWTQRQLIALLRTGTTGQGIGHGSPARG